MYIRRILYSEFGKYMISIILGLGIATLFRKVCKDRSCLVFKAPPIEKISGQVFKYNNKCYKFKETAATCEPNKKQISFA